jgi:acylphosphatase
MTTTARRIRVHGKVQGVFYRGWTVDEARALGLDGWVRNRLDGSVEIVAVGSAEAVDTLVARCHEGPPAARVDRVDVEETPGIVAQGFTQKPTV